MSEREIFSLDSGLTVYKLNGNYLATMNGEKVCSSRSYISLLKELRRRRYISGDEYQYRVEEWRTE